MRTYSTIYYPSKLYGLHAPYIAFLGYGSFPLQDMSKFLGKYSYAGFLDTRQIISTGLKTHAAANLGRFNLHSLGSRIVFLEPFVIFEVNVVRDIMNAYMD